MTKMVCNKCKHKFDIEIVAGVIKCPKCGHILEITFTADKYGVPLRMGEKMTREEAINRGFNPDIHTWILKGEDKK